MSLENFIKEHYPEMEVIYKRSLRSWDDLQPGTIVLTLRAGFGGGPGEFRKVKEIGKDKFGEYILLVCLDEKHNESKSILYKEDLDPGYSEYWWQAVVKVDYNYIKSLPRYFKHIDNTIANKIVG
jgi:hypothetical protein